MYDHIREKRLLLILNPMAGKRLAQSKLYEIIDRFVKEGYEVTVHPTQSRGDATAQVLQKGERFCRIVCCGGDGTLNEVITGLEGLCIRPELGYIPTGTTNDFAQSLGFSKNPAQAAETAATGVPFPCDIGRFGDRCFTYIAAFGAFTDVAYTTDQQAKNLFGGIAYFFEGVKRLGSIRSYPMEVVTETGMIQDEFIFGAVANSLSIAGHRGFFADDVSLNDGQFEVLLIRRPQTPADLNKIISDLLTQQFDQQQIRCFRASSISFRAAAPTAWTLDGEDGGGHLEASICCLPKAVTFIIDPYPQALREEKKTGSPSLVPEPNP